jgi:hypothetical protein
MSYEILHTLNQSFFPLLTAVAGIYAGMAVGTIFLFAARVVIESLALLVRGAARRGGEEDDRD